MLKAFISNLKKTNWENPSQKTLLAVSGGRDSVVLCELYKQAGLNFSMAHCNFGLRGVESDEDESFVVNLAYKYQVVLHRKKCQTKEYAAEKGISIQMAARELRFQWFEELCEEFGYDFYATAHHSDDAIETYLINQIRGTGISGFHGILPGKGKLVHPLLFASREDIDVFIKEKKLQYREDSSNSSTKYMRNKIRHQVLPLLTEINPQIRQVFLDNISRMSDAEQIYSLKIEELKKASCSWKNQQFLIQIADIIKYDFSPTLLYEIIKEFGFNYVQAQQSISELKEKESGAKFYSSTHTMLRNRDFLIIQETNQFEISQYYISDDLKRLQVDGEFFFEITQEKEIKKNHQVGQFDLDKLSFPLVLRKWKTGDFFYPLGMNMKKKMVSDYFIDEKFSIFDKENTWLLCSEQQIIWVVGHRMDERFKISHSTENVFQASFFKNS